MLTPLDIATAKPTQSLRQSALAHLLDTYLQSPDPDLSWLEEAELLSDFLPALRSRLASEPTLTDLSTAAKNLLVHAIEHEREVDLSPFQNFSAKELSDIICRLSNTVSLSLSGLNVSAELLVLDQTAANTSLRKLYALDSPNLQLQSVLKLMHEPKAPFIYHADMFRRPLQNQAKQHTTNYQDTPQPTSNDDMWLSRANLKFPVVQIVLLSREFKFDAESGRLDDGGLPWAQILQASDPDRRWGDRFGPFLAGFPLRDALLSTPRVVTGLAKLMRYLIQFGFLNIGDEVGTVAMAAAKCFALAASDLQEPDIAKQVSYQTLLFLSHREQNCYAVT